MAQISQSVHIHENQQIFNEGDPGDCAYIIEKGRVLVYITKDKEEIPISILGEGEIFGEMSLIDNQVRSASVKALEEVVLSIVTKHQVLERISTADTVVQLLFRVLMKRLRRKNVHASGALEAADVENTGAGDDKTKQALNIIQFENQLFAAFQNNEFQLYYQPILELKTRKIVGVEALLRWKSPTRGLVAPNLFIDVIENSSMVIPIGHWIIGQALKDLKNIRQFLREKGLLKLSEDFIMSINISGRQFTHADFVQNLEDLRQKYEVPTKNIKLEMTERVMMAGAVAIDALQKCKSLGYSIAIDDFGTGFSSLQYLAQMPISCLKIDRSFTMKVLSDSKTRAVVSTMIHLGHAMEMEIISEGIETNEECIVLETLGSQFGQGYLFAKPMDYHNLLNFL